MERNGKRENRGFVLVQVFILLLILGIVIYAYGNDLLELRELLIVLLVLAALSIPVILKLKRPNGVSGLTGTGNQSAEGQVSGNPGNASASGDPTVSASSGSIGQTPGGSAIAAAATTVPATTKKIPLQIILPAAVIVFCVLYVFGGFSLFNTSPVGKWYYEMETSEGNLTEYWYMELYADGTVDVGWKNVGFAEASQGHGTWTVDGKILTITVDYDWNVVPDFSDEFVIKGNKLYYASGAFTGYVKE